MKKLTKFPKTLLTCFLLTGVYMLFSSHFIWIETATVVTVGKEQLIKLFYGEIADNLIEQSGKKLEDVNGLKSFCINPKNEEKELSLAKQQDGYTTRFTPETGGVHQVLTTNNVREVMDLRKSNLGIVRPMYYSRNNILAMDKTNTDYLKTTTLTPYFELDILPDYSHSNLNVFPVNQPILLHTFFKKAPSKGKLFAYAPNGWAKEIEANDKGIATFTPLWEGQYVIDWVYTENTPGTYKGKPYEAIRHRAVLTIIVGK